MLASLKARAKALMQELTTLSIALRDPRTPWHAKALIAFVLAYALSPIDLIPDFIPVFGYLDDILVIPAGIALALKIIPADILKDAGNKATRDPISPSAFGAIGMIIVIFIWMAVAAWFIWRLCLLLSTIKG